MSASKYEPPVVSPHNNKREGHGENVAVKLPYLTHHGGVGKPSAQTTMVDRLHDINARIIQRQLEHAQRHAPPESPKFNLEEIMKAKLHELRLEQEARQPRRTKVVPRALLPCLPPSELTALVERTTSFSHYHAEKLERDRLEHIALQKGMR
jgi:hypothetical protein